MHAFQDYTQFRTEYFIIIDKIYKFVSYLFRQLFLQYRITLRYLYVRLLIKNNLLLIYYYYYENNFLNDVGGKFHEYGGPNVFEHPS